MKIISYVICVIFILVLSSCAKQMWEPLPELKPIEPESQEVTAKTEWSEEESEEIASHLLRNSNTFAKREGIEDSLTLLNTTLLEQPFSWQFEYEFKCNVTGYGMPQPSPKAITLHKAEVVVQEGEVTSAVLDDRWDVLRQKMIGATSGEEGEGSAPKLPEGNLVRVNIIEEYLCSVSGDSYINKEIAVERWWRTNMMNEPDETRAQVTELKLTLDSDVSFEGLGKGIEREFLTTVGPPTYEWSLGNIPNAENVTTGGWPWDAWVSIDSTKYTTEWTQLFEPGYDVSRSFDKTEFSAPDIQTMTITIIPREGLIDEISIFVHTEENNLVNPVVTSYSCANGGDVNIEQEGHRSGIHWIPAELNTPITIIVTIKVTPKVDLIQYKPYTAILPVHLSTPSSGTTVGSSVSFTNDAGTWTWSADGEYVWQWVGHDYVPVTIKFNESVNVNENALTISIFVFSGIAVVIILSGFIMYRRWHRRRAITS